jgi:hypothetical protein
MLKSFKEITDTPLDEAIKRKIVIRDGKRKIKFVTDKQGYKVVNKKEVKISAADAIKMSIRNKKSARKAAGKRASANRKRQRSINKRTGT